MQTKTSYEEEILKEVGSMPEDVQKKIAKFINLEEGNDTDEFLAVCGTWEDNRSVEKQLKDIYSNRRSTYRTEKVF